MLTFGECSVKIGATRRTLRGEAELELAGLDTAVEGNMDGSVYQTAKTAPITLKLTLEDEEDLTLSTDFMTTAQDITFSEDQNGRSHLLANAKVAGKPVYNPASGAVTGMTFACARRDYKRLS